MSYTSEKVQESRKYVRVPFWAVIQYGKAKTRASKEFKYASTKDLSVGGISFEAYNTFPVSTVIELKFAVPDMEEPIVVKGQVVRVEEIRKPWLYLMAVSFTETTTKTKKALEKLIGHYS